MRPGRQLAVLGLVFVVLYLLVFLGAGAKGGFRDRLEPKLGLDLVGGTQATYRASLQNGQVPPPASMEEARKIIDSRVNALGVSEAEVVIEGDRNIVVSVAGEQNDQLKTVGQPAQMRFRKVLKVTGDPDVAPPPASAAPSGSAAPSAAPSVGAGTGPKVTGSSAPSTAASTGGQGGGAPAPSPSAPAPAPAASAPAPAASAPAEAPVGEDVATQRAAVQKKVGAAAWDAASKLTDPPDPTDPAAAKVYAPFAKLTAAEVNVLPAQMQFAVPTIGCEQLNARPAGALDDEKTPVTACQTGAKLFLDKAKVVGTDIANATPQLDQQNGQWVVSLNFDAEGQKKWTALTREAFQPAAGDTCLTAAQALSQGATHCLVAVVLDKEILSAPEIQGVLTGESQITGSFTAATARDLADKLKFGAVPVTLTVPTTQSVSATLGVAQLRAGLLAAAIGMLLVAIYSFFYYRLLGTVIFLSLILSGLLTFGALVFLGRSMGFTLTLAGIAGFIVSLGVAADSFVIYFERLKDEIHEGRSPRSAVPRAWARARRTIISANTITILAAVVLYVVSIGAVKGFAFALGLSTILDLVVVFLFRHPIMTMFANTKAFLSPRVSGLGRVLRRANTDEPATTRSSRVKEA
jgi:preprotein translocase subunit SecD